MDVLVESTKKFEKDLNALGETERAIVMQTVDDCANLFLTQKAALYQKLRSLPLSSDLNGYESSLYMLQVSRKLRAILAVDEDPIFGQVIFTLFRVVNHDDLDRAIKGVQESLYQDLLHQRQEEPAQIL